MPDPIRILLIDDHALVREGIARLLAAQPDFHVAGDVATVDEGLAIVRSTPVDVVLLDINLGTHQGGSFLDLARSAGFQGQVLVVTAGVSRIEAERLLRKGYSGIFLKHERPPVLIERIRTVVSGDTGSAMPPEATAAQLLENNNAALPHFTARELQVLRGVFAGLTNKEIAAELEISEPLVKAFLQQLFRKAGVHSRTQLVRIAMEKYWKYLDQEPEDTVK